MTAHQKLESRTNDGFHICVGLDTDISKIPHHLHLVKNPVMEFNKIIIDNTYQYAAAYKINFAFYEKYGSKGFEIIFETINYLKNSNILTIGDAKRGDIGNTSQMYAKSIYDYFEFDAATINPYMGKDSIDPFLQYSNKINFILALTSNPGSKDFEKLKLANGVYLFQQVINSVASWNENNNCGLVFGATNLSELEENISSFGDLPILLPGVGSQGGNLEGVVKTFHKAKKSNFVLNVSRALIYCDEGTEFGNRVSEKIKEINESVSKFI